MSELTGKVAIVTGASKGIGAAIAKGLAAVGASVVVNYASSREGADRVVAEIAGKGGKAIAVEADVSKAADVQRLFDETKKAFGFNVLGVLLASREALKYFGPDGGSVINISSVASMSPTPTAVIYSATKGAVDTITRVLAKELGPKKIRVNAINPGGVETEGLHSMGIIGSEFEKQIVARTPLGRLGQPDDIASVAVFLASTSSGWMTGETIAVGGGFS